MHGLLSIFRWTERDGDASGERRNEATTVVNGGSMNGPEDR